MGNGVIAVKAETSRGKAAAIATAVEGPRTVEVPASALQTHADTVLLIDDAAASQLTRWQNSRQPGSASG